MIYAPEKGSKGYARVLGRGCGLRYDAWNGDYDCDHRYPWDCDNCPMVVEYQGQAEEDVETVELEIPY